MKISKMIMTRGSLIIFLLIVWESTAQELIPMGTWRSHFNYQQTSLVEKTNNNIFAVTSHGLMYYDPEDQSINKLSKVDGLSDVGITAIAYDSDEEYLVLGYQNGNVDLINENGILNLPILLNSDITDDKEINHIGFHEGKIHLSTNFGLLVLTTENKVEEAYLNLGDDGETIKIYASVVINNQLFIASESGVLAGELNAGVNLQDFNNWKRFEGSPVDMQEIESLVVDNDNIYASSASLLYKMTNDNWANIPLTLEPAEEILKLRNGISRPLVLTNQSLLQLNADDTFTSITQPANASILDIYQEDQNVYWYADDNRGLTRLEGSSTSHIVLDGPSNQLTRLKILEGNVYAFPDLSTNYSAAVSNEMGYSILEDGNWQILAPSDINGFDNITDIFVYNNETLLASFGAGILKLNTGDIIDHTNSPLDENESDTGNTLVSGILQDVDQQLWITNFSNYSLLKWDDDDNWTTYDFGSSAAAEPVKSVINQSNQIWMILGLLDGRGIMGFDIATSTYRYVNTTATSLPSNQVNDIAFGHKDEIWIATDNGVAYFPFSFGIIEDQTIDISLPVFEESVLFENKPVHALAVDGGNRIWMGSTDGLWLFSENIQELVHQFDVDNSPLPSNNIIDLEIHPDTGELFILTDEGLVSYRTDATLGTNQHQLVQIYPNPVLPGFEGWVGFSGLAENVRLKITTISGQLIREINANGGGASWDITDYSGHRVDTGVYLIFSASSNGSETYVGKIAIIK